MNWSYTAKQHNSTKQRRICCRFDNYFWPYAAIHSWTSQKKVLFKWMIILSTPGWLYKHRWRLHHWSTANIIDDCGPAQSNKNMNRIVLLKTNTDQHQSLFYIALVHMNPSMHMCHYKALSKVIDCGTPVLPFFPNDAGNTAVLVNRLQGSQLFIYCSEYTNYLASPNRAWKIRFRTTGASWPGFLQQLW